VLLPTAEPIPSLKVESSVVGNIGVEDPLGGVMDLGSTVFQGFQTCAQVTAFENPPPSPLTTISSAQSLLGNFELKYPAYEERKADFESTMAWPSIS
jgi:hypothetical protein